MVTICGTVEKVLNDSHTDKGTHQMFKIRLGNGQIVLVANNVDQGSRVNLVVGRPIEVHGEFQPRAGRYHDDFIHFTHRAYEGGREGGWIFQEGVYYE
jgi:hypothetical protein